LTVSPDGKRVAVGNDTDIAVWDRKTGKWLFVAKHHLSSVTALVYSPDSRLLLSGGMRGPISCWETRTGKELWSIRTHTHPDGGVIVVESIAFHPSGKTFASSGCDGVVRVWDTATHSELRAFQGLSQTITCVAYSPDGRLLAGSAGIMTTFPGEVTFWNASSGEYLGRGLPRFQSWILKVQFWPDGTRLAVGAGSGKEGVVEIWDVSRILPAK
jgi:WD40 repeat protein